MASPKSVNLIQAAERAGGFSLFLAAIADAGMDETLRGGGRYTIFAPTDEAFAKLSAAARGTLEAGGAAFAKQMVSLHLVSGQLLSQRLKGKRIRGKSVGGGELVIDGGEGVSVNGASMTRPDIMAANGVLHGIDKVLWAAPGGKRAPLN